jgi:hypothetical protein
MVATTTAICDAVPVTTHHWPSRRALLTENINGTAMRAAMRFLEGQMARAVTDNLLVLNLYAYSTVLYTLMSACLVWSTRCSAAAAVAHLSQDKLEASAPVEPIYSINHVLRG